MKIQLAAFIELLPSLEKQAREAIQRELVAIAPQIVETAQNKIGAYQDGWAPLAQSTINERTHLGYSPDEPLLRTGDLRNSYEAIVSENHIVVGNYDPKAEYVEIGTATIPPRPVTLPAVYESLEQLQKSLGAAVVASLSDEVDLG